MKDSSFKQLFDDAKNKVEDAFNRAPEDLKEALADMMENMGKLMGDIKENLNKNAEHLKKSAQKQETPQGATAEEPPKEANQDAGAQEKKEQTGKDGFESFQDSFKKAATEFKVIMEEELGHIAERMDELTEKVRKYRSEKNTDKKEDPKEPDPKDFV
ncbi:MAG: hypothetical protein H6563_14575 [Lewinellaceae bacterium]|nr:hypothetical protein [Lewinellaceae bacterium]